MREMGEISTLGPNRTGGIDRLTDTHVGRMRPPPERVQDQDLAAARCPRSASATAFTSVIYARGPNRYPKTRR